MARVQYNGTIQGTVVARYNTMVQYKVQWWQGYNTMVQYKVQWWQGRRPPLKREWSGKDLSEFPHTAVLLPASICKSYVKNKKVKVKKINEKVNV